MRVLLGNEQYQGRRKEQQDSFGSTDPDDNSFRLNGGVLGIVADGMGGMAHGGAASNIAKKVFIYNYEQKQRDESIPVVLGRAIQAANRAVFSLASEHNLAGEIGTTLAAAVIHEDRLYWISAGDSRVYLCRAGKLVQLTQDHDYALELSEAVARGEISRDQALNDPERSHLISYLGMEDLPRIDQNRSGYPLRDGDRILLCSDGLYRALSDTEIASALNADPQSACELLIQQVKDKQRPKQDNTTLIVMACEEEAAPTVTIPVRVDEVEEEEGKFRFNAKVLLAILAIVILLVVIVFGLYQTFGPSSDQRDVESPVSEEAEVTPARVDDRDDSEPAPATTGTDDEEQPLSEPAEQREREDSKPTPTDPKPRPEVKAAPKEVATPSPPTRPVVKPKPAQVKTEPVTTPVSPVQGDPKKNTQPEFQEPAPEAAPADPPPAQPSGQPEITPEAEAPGTTEPAEAKPQAPNPVSTQAEEAEPQKATPSKTQPEQPEKPPEEESANPQASPVDNPSTETPSVSTDEPSTEPSSEEENTKAHPDYPVPEANRKETGKNVP